MSRLEPRRPTLEEFAQYLETEAERLRDNRWKIHGGTRHRYDLDHWADALKWAARKARTQAGGQSET
jgi:hypothetical protein